MSLVIADDLRRKIKDSDYDRIINILAAKGYDKTREDIENALACTKLESGSVGRLQCFLKYYLTLRAIEDSFFDSMSMDHLGATEFDLLIKQSVRNAGNQIQELNRSSWYPEVLNPKWP